MKTLTLLGLSLFTCVSALAQQPQRQPPAPGPSMALALEAAQEAIKTCAASGYNVTVTVLDSAGELKAVLRSDAASARTLDISRRKANTSLKYNEATLVISEKVKSDKELAAEIEQDKSLLSWGGARPLASKGQLLGAIGVSGAPGGDKDDVCTQAGVAKIQGRL